MKKFLISIILCLLVITGCGVKDSVKFKHEYEALNGEKEKRPYGRNKNQD